MQKSPKGFLLAQVGRKISDGQKVGFVVITSCIHTYIQYVYTHTYACMYVCVCIYNTFICSHTQFI